MTEQNFWTITDEQAATVARLKDLQAYGWHGLQDMSRADLERLRTDAAQAHVMFYSPEHPHNMTCSDAIEAINAECLRRDIEQAEQSRKQQQRKSDISRAAGLIREAIELVGYAAEIPNLQQLPPMPKAIDVAAADDDELTDAFNNCALIVGMKSDSAAEDARALAAIKTDAAKSICKELQAKARHDAERRDQAQKLLTAIEAERQRREDERRAEIERLQPKSLESRIEALESELASLRGVDG